MRKATRTRSDVLGVLGSGLLTAASLLCLALPAAAQNVPETAIPDRAPKYFPFTYRSAMSAPLPFSIGNETLPVTVPAKGTAPNGSGTVGFVAPEAARTIGANEHPFYKSMGSNGRSCGTCHQPSMAMGLSVSNIKERFRKFGVKDPLFAPVDGANCPNLVPASETKPSKYYGGRRGRGANANSAKARSLLLNDGLIRVFMPLQTGSINPIIDVKVQDPYGCNTSPEFGKDPQTGKPIYSMYRRPLISANLDFKTKFLPLGATRSGNIMWDGREPTLASQALNATLGHAQRDNVASNPDGLGELTTTSPEIVAIVNYEEGFFAAQQTDRRARALDAAGAQGGAQKLKENIAANGVLPPFPPPAPPAPFAIPFTEFDAWTDLSGGGISVAQRESIARGAKLFNGTAENNRGRFTISKVAGFNDVFGGADVPNSTCGTCHNGLHGGGDMLPNNQRNIGISGDFAGRGGHPLRTDLPIFTVTCAAKPDFQDSNVFKTNDMGLALHTGECADVGKTTVPSIRGLASRAPYFHDGSANTIADIVNFYNIRFSMGLTKQEKADLTNFLAAL